MRMMIGGKKYKGKSEINWQNVNVKDDEEKG